MQTEIFYNNKNPFAGAASPFPPLVSIRDEMVFYGERWADKNVITLAGMITGVECVYGMAGITGFQEQLLQSFSQDFQSFAIIENGVTIFSGDSAVIESVNFPSSNYKKVLNYQIRLSCFQENLFSGVYGVIEPVQQIRYAEGEDGIVVVNRTLSARGFNTSSASNTNNAFNNAESWVQTRTGWNTTYFADSLPYFISYNGTPPCIKKQIETINRLEGFYGIEEEYAFYPPSTSPIIIKYGTDIQYDETKGIYDAGIKGEIIGCPTASIADTRGAFEELDLYSLANYQYQLMFPGEPPLNPDYLAENIEENEALNKITFTRSYDSDDRSPVFFDYDISIDYDVVTDIYTASLNGVIKARSSQKVQWERVLNYYLTQLNVFQTVSTFFTGNGYPYSLVQYPLSYSIVENPFAGEIQIQASYSNILQPEPGFDTFSYEVEITPSVNEYVPVPAICGTYYVINLQALKRAKITVNGKAFSLNNANQASSVSALMMSILNQYIEQPNNNPVNKVVEISSETVAQGQLYNFEYSVAYTGPQFNIT